MLRPASRAERRFRFPAQARSQPVTTVNSCGDSKAKFSSQHAVDFDDLTGIGGPLHPERIVEELIYSIS